MNIINRRLAVNISNKQKLHVLGDELLCFTMLSNLLTNAIEAAPPNSTISINIIEKDAVVCVTIHNFGTVPESIKDTLFEKYVTAGKKGGTGLGTYSAKLIAETQGGTISFISSDDKGTTFIISLKSASQGIS